MRVLVTGGRTYGDAARLQAVLDKLHAEAGIDVIIEGGANGADMLARNWARANVVNGSTFEADWKSFGSFAGPKRNTAMLQEGRPDVVIAFPGGTGTRNMKDQARKFGVEVIEIAP